MLEENALAACRGTPVAEKLESVLGKLVALLPEPLAVDPAELFSQFSFAARPSIPVQPEIWSTVVAGLIQNRQLEIRYNGKISRIHPLHLANLQGQWYLFARFYDYANFKQLSLGRMQSASLLEQPVNAEGFDVTRFVGATSGRFAGDRLAFDVELEFAADVADSVLEREWHPNQQATRQPDGSVRLRFHAKGEMELKR